MLSSLLVMAWVVEARDPYTGGHLWRVAQFCELLAQKAGFAAEEVARIALGGFVHDLGKVGIPDAVLRKAGPLSDEEYAVIKTHPISVFGCCMPTPGHAGGGRRTPAPRDAGWPGLSAGLKADEIPHLASIVGICDAFDAMTAPAPIVRACRRHRRCRSSARTWGASSTRTSAHCLSSWGSQGS
ncbi:HD domain-containing protein [Pseudomonas sp. PCH446]